MKDEIRRLLMDSGALAVGFATAGEVDPDCRDSFKAWVRGGNHAGMAYLERHVNLRSHTDNVLPDAKTVISLAYSYVPKTKRDARSSMIAPYAYGDDYHLVLREILKPRVEELREKYGGKWRICIDSAPVAERYWALKSGIGIKGLNGNVIVKGAGSFCYLAEVLTTLEIEADAESAQVCEGCGKCVAACPGKALKADGLIDANLCINYLTIEKKGDFASAEGELTGKVGNSLYGCDLCMKVCPHNRCQKETNIKSFLLRDEIRTLTPEEVMTMDEETFKRRFSRSPLLYAGYEKLKRNSENLLKGYGHAVERE